jgi:hypothetical protein
MGGREWDEKGREGIRRGWDGKEREGKGKMKREGMGRQREG